MEAAYTCFCQYCYYLQQPNEMISLLWGNGVNKGVRNLRHITLEDKELTQ